MLRLKLFKKGEKFFRRVDCNVEFRKLSQSAFVRPYDPRPSKYGVQLGLDQDALAVLAGSTRRGAMFPNGRRSQ